MKRGRKNKKERTRKKEQQSREIENRSREREYLFKKERGAEEILLFGVEENKSWPVLLVFLE